MILFQICRSDPLLFSTLLVFFGSYQLCLLAVACLFLIGLIILNFVDEDKGIKNTQNVK